MGALADEGHVDAGRARDRRVRVKREEPRLRTGGKREAWALELAMLWCVLQLVNCTSESRRVVPGCGRAVLFPNSFAVSASGEW